ncbi:MAG TPA: EAL domain-containing response regulator [Xanthobacteraceae bacterium]|nr:EAL domain-containing response regulator [Xanthobacteraceae bacterium]
MTEILDRPAPDGATAAADSGGAAAGHATPLCYVVEEESSIRHFLSLILHGSGVDTEEFADGAAFRQGIRNRKPDLVFIDIALDSSDAIESVIALGKQGFFGFVQLMSNRGSAVLEHVKAIGEQHKLNMLPVLKKPFDTTAIVKIIHDLKLGHPPSVAARIGLDEALNNDWIEFWYQPKIDLRRKQLAGAEAFVRANHPQHGFLPPDAFMPGATDAEIARLSERALICVLKAGQNFSKVGVNLRLSVNIPVSALVKLPIGEIVRAHRSNVDNWPGLVIDVTEEQIVSDLALAAKITKELAPLNVRLAIDDFGRGYSSLARLKELPFAELKLDRSFVTDCGTDKVNAPLCKTVIDLAHNFGSVAVAIGIEKASDALALVSMGCDYGQGFLLGQPMPEDRFTSLLRQRAQSASRAASGAAVQKTA